MKRALGIFLAIFALGTGGCASVQSKYYTDLAKEHDFKYYFPSSNFYRTFSTPEEAYEYIKTAQAKFAGVVNKPLAKGLAAKLTGPVVTKEKPVAIGCLMIAYNLNVDADLANTEEPLETVLQKAISASLIFLVFYGDRGVSIPNYYLRTGYSFTAGNAQSKSFGSFGNSYEADYPVGWNTEKAFSYLKKEID